MLRSNRLDASVLPFALGLTLALGACTDAVPLRPGVLPRASLPGIVPVDPVLASEGRVIYQRNCASCHGENADGRDMMNGPQEVPRPRNFVAGIYNCRSTVSGSLPLPSDLAATISRGLHATAMPAWEILGNAQILEVTEYIRSVSPRWTTEQVAAPLVIPPEPQDDTQSQARGRDVFNRVQCQACHGDHGEGDGPASSSLRDETGQPIAPFNFIHGELHCGSRPEDLYRTFMTGMDGTPMPSFAASLEPHDAWDLVHYVRSLRR